MNKKKSVLITGANGFVGHHLTGLLLQKGYRVYGLDLVPPADPNLSKQNYKYIPADLLNSPDLAELIKASKPAGVFHLAGESNVATSWKYPEKTLDLNVLGGYRLLAALAKNKYSGLTILISSGEVYGRPEKENVSFLETDALRPASPYAASKAALDLLSAGYSLGGKLNIIRLRPFNHIGPGQKDSFVVSDFSRQIAMIEAGRQAPVLEVGNLETSRDFLDVRDVVAAYYAAFRKCPAGEVFNICSGHPVAIKKILRILLGLSGTKIKVTVNKNKFRKIEIKSVSGNNGRFCRATNWRPTVPLEKSLGDVLNFWRQKIRS